MQSKRRRNVLSICFFIDFVNKGLDLIKISSILHDQDVIDSLPDNLKTDEVPSVVYRLTKTIRNKIFNYKQTVADINTDDHDTFGTGLDSCQCENSPYIDSNHGHIVTGDLRFVENSVLRKLLCKGPNYREPRPINLKYCRKKYQQVQMFVQRKWGMGKMESIFQNGKMFLCEQCTLE